MKHILPKLALGILFSVGGMTASAEEQHTQHSEHMEMQAQSEAQFQSEAQTMDVMAMPTEGGQAAFTAIAEIVALLNADPNTDWSQVDIDRLRHHLVDMNELTLNAVAVRRLDGNAVVFEISGHGRTLQAIKAMVPTHALELAKIAGWDVSTEVKSQSVILKLVANADELKKIQALGFFGLMAMQAHHQAHHWGMATGSMSGH